MPPGIHIYILYTVFQMHIHIQSTHICFISHLQALYFFFFFFFFGIVEAQSVRLQAEEAMNIGRKWKGKRLNVLGRTRTHTQTHKNFFSSAAECIIMCYVCSCISLFWLPLYTYRRFSALTCLLTHIRLLHGSIKQVCNVVLAEPTWPWLSVLLWVYKQT